MDDLKSNNSFHGGERAENNNKKGWRVVVRLVILWLIYLPFAMFIFAVSAMGFDSPNMSLWAQIVSLVIAAAVNLIPLRAMMVMTSKSLQGKNRASMTDAVNNK